MTDTDSSPPRSKRPLAVLAMAWVGALALVAMTSADCGIDHRSQEFACTTTADCTQGRTCIDGYCVTGMGSGSGSGSGSNHVDAGVDARVDASHVDAGSGCPTICSSCDVAGKTCGIDCSIGTNRCGGGGGVSPPVTCPPGYTCNIDCNTQGSCRSVSCMGAASCTINCTVDGSCRTVTCGAGACDVLCNGQNSCRDVFCGGSCQCDVACLNSGTCSDQVQCTHSVCDDFVNGGCDTTNSDSCQTCP